MDVFDFGATPLSTIRSSVDVMISGPDLGNARPIGSEVEQRLQKNLRGATSITRSWTLDSVEVQFTADAGETARFTRFHLPPWPAQLAGAVRGMPSSVFRVPNQDGLTVWIQLPPAQREHAEQLATYPIQTPVGAVPLAQLGIDLAPDPSRRSSRARDSNARWTSRLTARKPAHLAFAGGCGKGA